MGLFDWLSGKAAKKVAVAEYRIWLTQEAKAAGICDEVAKAAARFLGRK